jgi:oligopeptide/dipeptide ABC transporter ATP-binding protein
VVFQDPQTSLDPVFTIGYQVIEALKTHQKISKKESHQKAVDLLEAVGIPSAIPTIENLEFEGKTDIKGETPNPINLPSGCPFHPRCLRRLEICDQILPKTKTMDNGHTVCCHLVND